MENYIESLNNFTNNLLPHWRIYLMLSLSPVVLVAVFMALKEDLEEKLLFYSRYIWFASVPNSILWALLLVNFSKPKSPIVVILIIVFATFILPFGYVGLYYLGIMRGKR